MGIGGATSTPTTSAVTQNTVVWSGAGLEKDDLFTLVDSSDDSCVFAFQAPADGDVAVFSCPEITSGSSYTLYKNGTVYGETNFYGLLLESLSYEEGTASSSFTVSSTVTTVGGSPTGPN